MGAMIQGLPPWVLARDAAGKQSGKVEHAELGLQVMTDTAGNLWAWNPLMPVPEWQRVHVLAGNLNNLWSVSGHYYGTPSYAGEKKIYGVPQNQPILGSDWKSAFVGETILIPGLNQPAPGPTGQLPGGTTPTGVGGLPTGFPTGQVPTSKPDWWPSDWPWPPTTAVGPTPGGTGSGATPATTTPATGTPTSLPSARPDWWPANLPWPPVPGQLPTGITPTTVGTGGTPATTTNGGEGMSTRTKVLIGAGVGVVVIGGGIAIWALSKKKRRRRRG